MLEKVESIEPKSGPLYALTVGEELTFIGGSSKLVYAFPTHHLEFPKFQINVENSVYTMNYCDATEQLWMGHSNGELSVIDIPSRTFVKRYQLGSPGLFAICFIGQEVYVGGGDGKVSVWDLNSLEFKRVYTLSDSKVRRIIPSDRGVYCSFSNGEIEELDLVYGNRLAKWKAHSDGVFALAKHPNKPVLFTGGKDGMLRGWNLQNQEMVFEFPAHESTIYDIVFLQDGEQFISAGRDKKIKVWSAVDLSHLDTQDGTRSFNRLAKVSDSSVLAVGDDGQLSKWILNTN